MFIHIRAGHHNNHEISRRSTGRSGSAKQLLRACEDVTQTAHTTPAAFF